MSLCEENKLGLHEGDKVIMKASLVITGFYEQHDTGRVLVYLGLEDNPRKFTVTLEPKQVVALKKNPLNILHILCNSEDFDE